MYFVHCKLKVEKRCATNVYVPELDLITIYVSRFFRRHLLFYWPLGGFQYVMTKKYIHYRFLIDLAVYEIGIFRHWNCKVEKSGILNKKEVLAVTCRMHHLTLKKLHYEY